MALLLDIYGFLSVMLRGVILAAQSLAVGGIVFLGLLAAPFARRLGGDGAAVLAGTTRLLFWSATGFAAAVLVSVTLECTVLAGTLSIPLGEAFGAGFARFGLVAAAAALAAAFLAATPPTPARVAALGVLALVMLAAQVATSHAAAQLSERGLL